MNSSNRGTTLPNDRLGELISAYLDGELSQREAAEVERALASDPAAKRFAEDLARLSEGCLQAPAPTFCVNLAPKVLAEALRRQSAGGSAEDNDQSVPVEPEGYFGLPLSKASRGWSWALVAAAAAVLIGFYGRPGAPQGRAVVTSSPTANAQQLAAYLQAMQRAAPGMQVVNFQATPDMYAKLRQRLAFQNPQRAQLPGELMAVSQKGVTVEPIEAPANSEEQLVYVDADQSELDRLLGELGREEGESLVQVDPATKVETNRQPAPSGLRAVPLRVEATPEALAKLGQQTPVPGAATRRFIVLRIQLRPQQ